MSTNKSLKTLSVRVLYWDNLTVFYNSVFFVQFLQFFLFSFLHQENVKTRVFLPCVFSSNVNKCIYYSASNSFERNLKFSSGTDFHISKTVFLLQVFFL